MNLLDRYLAAIRHNLPSRRAEDIANELRDELLDRIEAHEAQLGRPLDEAETIALLQAFGHPLVIAARYREHQYLIGPHIYPFYVYGLRVVLVIALLVLLFAAIVPLLMGADHPAGVFFLGLGHAYGVLLAGFAWFTIVMAGMERFGPSATHLQRWKPETLPPPDQKPRNKWSSPIEIGFGLLFLLWWAGQLPFPLIGLGSGLNIGETAIWSVLYWPILVLGAVRLAFNVMNWRRPEWTKLRMTLGLGTHVCILWLIAYLRGHGPWLTVSKPGMDPHALATVAASINMAFHVVLMIALIVWGFGLVMMVYQLYLRRFMLGR